MTIECKIRFVIPAHSSIALDQLTNQEKASSWKFRGGFCFQTEKTPVDVLDLLDSIGIGFDCIENIEFKNYSKE